MNFIKSKIAIALVVLMMLWSGTSIVYSIGSDDSSLSSLTGGMVSCDCNSCLMADRVRYECFHTSMDPAVTCSTTFCIKDWVCFSFCDVDFSGGSCPTKYDANQIRIAQWKHAVSDGNTDCASASQQVDPDLMDMGPCEYATGSVFPGRCEIDEDACGGAMLEVGAERMGNLICDY